MSEDYICLAGQFHAAELTRLKDGREYLKPICDHRHSRKSAAIACKERIEAGKPEPAHFRNLAEDDLNSERNFAALGIAVNLWQALKDRIDSPAPESPARVKPVKPPAVNDARPRPVAELSGWQGSKEAAFYLTKNEAGEFDYLRQDEAARRIRGEIP